MNTAHKIERAKTHLRVLRRHVDELDKEIDDKERRLQSIRGMELTNKAIANMLDVSERTVTRMLSDGRLASRMADDVLEYQKRN
ncbi:hypothetical protein [Fodinibius sp. SL11]|uniref:hypothetical protein n=1 Tax=Fodinibius sp. SL11 TaxID=3425690 RepID=UPI003F880FE0